MNVPAAAIREQPVDIIDIIDGSKVCTVQAGPKTHILHMKEDIHTASGIPDRQQKLFFDGHIFKDGDSLGVNLFRSVSHSEVPQLQFKQLSHEEADEEEGRLEAIDKIKHGEKLMHLPEEWRNDSEVVLFAVEHTNPAELQHASDEVKSDKDTMIEALKIGTMSMYYIHEDLWEDRGFMKRAVQIDGLLLGASMVPKKWTEDPEIVMYACEQHGYALKHASPEQQNNRSIVMAAVDQKGTALMYASDELKADYYVVLDAVRQNKMAIVHCKGGLREDDDIRAAAGQGPSTSMLDHDKVDRIKAKFHELDENGDGFLDLSELEDLLRQGNPDMDDDEIRLLYDQMDTHQDGKVDFHEFCDFIFGDDL